MITEGGWIVYILRCADGSLYTGITTDLERRVARHASGRGARYTKGRGPYEIIYQETHENRGAAARREAQIKALRREEKLALAGKISA